MGIGGTGIMEYDLNLVIKLLGDWVDIVNRPGAGIGLAPNCMIVFDKGTGNVRDGFDGSKRVMTFAGAAAIHFDATDLNIYSRMIKDCKQVKFVDFAADPTVNGELQRNADRLKYKHSTRVETVSWLSDNPGFINGLAVSYVSASVVQIAAGACLSNDDLEQMILAASQNVDITVAGLNGLDAGAEAASTWYYIWLIKNPATGAVAGLLSTSSTAPTLPGGYTKKRLLMAVRNDAASNLLNFQVCGAANFRKIYYVEDIDTILQVLSGGSATAFTGISCASLIPPITQHGIFNCHVTAKDAWFRTTGTTPATVKMMAGTSLDFEMVTNAAQSIDYYVLTIAGRLDVSVRGYCLAL